MDVHLAEEARHYLEATALGASRQKRDGLLLGHRRGQRYFVERAFSCRERYFSSLLNYLALERHFGGKIIGFFSLNAKLRRPPLFLKPFAYGKVFLKAKAGAGQRLIVKPFVIEYRNSFFLQPISFHSSPKEKT